MGKNKTRKLYKYYYLKSTRMLLLHSMILSKRISSEKKHTQIEKFSNRSGSFLLFLWWWW